MKSTLQETLKKFGVSEKEAEIYLFLGKKGAVKLGTITEYLKMNRGQVYRSLKRLQKKGLIEIVLESPARFAAIPLEKVIDSFIRSKKEEVTQIEETKKDLLYDWNAISQTELEASIEKFSVIKGEKKIFQKISQMIKDANNQFLITFTVSDLLKAEQSEVFDYANSHPIKSNTQFRVLTQLSMQNLKLYKILKSKLDCQLDLRGIDPRMRFPSFSRMAIQDKNEIIIFLSNPDEVISKELTCLCTNSKSIINAFFSVFENLWQNSIKLSQKIDDLKISGISNKIDPHLVITKKKIDRVFNSAKKELIIVTSSEGLETLPENNLQKLSDLGISIKIMAPITNENLHLSKKFLEFCKVKHVSYGYFPSIIVDRKYLYQQNADFSEPDSFFLVGDHDYENKTIRTFVNTWRTASPPSNSPLTQFLGPSPPSIVPNVDEKTYNVYRNSIGTSEEKSIGLKNDKDIIMEFINAKEYPVKDIAKDVVRAYQSTGHALIHPPDYFNLPKMLFHFYHVEKKSSLGREDLVSVSVWMKTHQGSTFVPVVVMGDNKRSHEAYKIWFKGTPAQDNIRLVDHNKFEVRVHGNAMFSAWSIPIPLIGKYVVPPACIIIEGYGNLRTGSYVATLPSGYNFKIDTNGFDAFVTFIHPKSKYSGAGTEGYLGRDEIMEIVPPSIKKTIIP